MLELTQTFPLGVGTYRIDETDKAAVLKGLHHSVERGQNYFSTGFSYGDGAVVDRLGEFFPTLDRDSFFLSAYVEPDVRTPEDIRKQAENYLRIFKTDYVDCLQVHLPLDTVVPLDGIYEQLQQLQQEGKVRYMGASNLSPDELSHLSQKVPLLLFEGLYNLECKHYEHLGVLDRCRQENIEFVCYQPLRRNRTAARNYPLLVELAQKYGYTQNQIILNWIIKEKKIRAIVKSVTPENIDTNLDALSFSMEQEDYARLNAFRCPEGEGIKVDWLGNGDGIKINFLANQF